MALLTIGCTARSREDETRNARNESKRTSKSSMVKVQSSFQMSHSYRDLRWPSRISVCIPMTTSSLHLLFVCLIVSWKKPGKLRLLCWEGSKPPGGDHTRAEAQTTCEPKIAAHTTYLSIYGEHSTSWRAGSHPWTYTGPIQNASSNERRPPCLV